MRNNRYGNVCGAGSVAAFMVLAWQLGLPSHRESGRVESVSATLCVLLLIAAATLGSRKWLYLLPGYAVAFVCVVLAALRFGF